MEERILFKFLSLSILLVNPKNYMMSYINDELALFSQDYIEINSCNQRFVSSFNYSFVVHVFFAFPHLTCLCLKSEVNGTK